jgi:carboxylate-amine ligase
MSGQVTAAPRRFSTESATLPLTIRERLLAVDKLTGENVLALDPSGSAWPESTVIVASRATGDLTELREMLVRGRRAAAQAAIRPGAHLVAIGTTPIVDPEATGAGPFLPDPALCDLIMRVTVPDARLVAPVCRHLEAWLPVLRGLTANSPICLGTDTGFASWRFVQSRRRALGALLPPRRGSTPASFLGSEVETAEARLASAMLPWHSRPSTNPPAVDIRVGDVTLSAADTVIVAGLVRAAVATAVEDVRSGHPAPLVDQGALRAAHWQAARAGLAGRLVDPRVNRLRPAWQVLDGFFASVSRALLASDDLDLVLDGLARIRSFGIGAEQQRRIYRRAGGIRPGLPALAEVTLAA